MLCLDYSYRHAKVTALPLKGAETQTHTHLKESEKCFDRWLNNVRWKQKRAQLTLLVEIKEVFREEGVPFPVS